MTVKNLYKIKGSLFFNENNKRELKNVEYVLPLTKAKQIEKYNDESGEKLKISYLKNTTQKPLKYQENIPLEDIKKMETTKQEQARIKIPEIKKKREENQKKRELLKLENIKKVGEEITAKKDEEIKQIITKKNEEKNNEIKKIESEIIQKKDEEIKQILTKKDEEIKQTGVKIIEEKNNEIKKIESEIIQKKDEEIKKLRQELEKYMNYIGDIKKELIIPEKYKIYYEIDSKKNNYIPVSHKIPENFIPDINDKYYYIYKGVSVNDDEKIIYLGNYKNAAYNLPGFINMKKTKINFVISDEKKENK